MEIPDIPEKALKNLIKSDTKDCHYILYSSYFCGFQFLLRPQMIEYFVGAPFSFNCPCLIT